MGKAMESWLGRGARAAVAVIVVVWGLGGCGLDAVPTQAAPDAEESVSPPTWPAPTSLTPSGLRRAEPASFMSPVPAFGSPGDARMAPPEFRFEPALIYSLGAAVGELKSVGIGDIDGDGRNDIVMATEATLMAEVGKSAMFIVLRQSPSGAMMPVLEFPYGSLFARDIMLSIGDVDGDGRVDAVVATSSGIYILRYRPGTGFRTTWAAGNCRRTVLMDIDLDGRMDIACHREAWLSFLHGDGQGQFSESSAINLLDTGFVDMKSADVTGDGYADLMLLRDRDVSELLVFPHNGVDGFDLSVGYALPPNIEPPYSIDVSEWGMSPGDFNGDGLTDLAVSTTNETPALFHVLYQVADERLFRMEEQPVSQPPAAFAVADFDKDGDDDLYVRFHAGAIANAAFLEQRSGELVERDGIVGAPGMPLYSNNATASGDVDSDACPDVVSVDGYRLYVNKGVDCLRRETGGRGLPRRL